MVGRLNQVKESLMAQIQAQMAHLDMVDAKELGEAIDMVKDLEEAIYYCTITKAMNEKEHEKEKEVHYYPIMYNDSNSSENNNSSRMYYGGDMGRKRVFGMDNYEYPVELRDAREGRSPKTRKMYMESKEMRKDKTTQLQELEQYMKELSEDIVEMIKGATPEEKQLLKSKMTTLVSKIDHA